MSSKGGPSTDIVLTDVDFVTSDLHLNHQNIIEYCRDDEFEISQSGLDDMNWRLLSEWNRHVERDDTVVFVGDFVWLMEQDPITQRKVDNLWDALNGRKVFVRGDHDHIIPSTADEVVYSAEIEREDRSYLVGHFPGDTPESIPGRGMPEEFRENLPDDFADRRDGWRIHGHHHNNWPETYPLANPERKTINCSVELTEYRPLRITEVDQMVQQNERVHSIGGLQTEDS